MSFICLSYKRRKGHSRHLCLLIIIKSKGAMIKQGLSKTRIGLIKGSPRALSRGHIGFGVLVAATRVTSAPVTQRLDP